MAKKSANSGENRSVDNAREKRRILQMDSISLIMFVFPFAMGFIFSLLGLFELKSALSDKEPPAIGFFFSLLSTIMWFIVSFLWPAVATSDMFVALSPLWFGLGWVFLIITFACVFYILKYSVSKHGGGLEIREEEPE
jgi:hypothetical protein